METFPVRIHNNEAVLRIRDVYPGSRIADLGSRIQQQQQKRRGKQFVVLPYLFCSHKVHNIKYYFIFERHIKKFS
jgi:hypothetical protein